MKFDSQICTTKIQSERLSALGLKKETADMYYFWVGGNEYRLKVDDDNNPLKYNMDRTYIPAWSLHRLKCLIPSKAPYGVGYLTVEIINENAYIVLVIENAEQRVLKYTKGNLYDNLISCINFFINEGLFNKEYLE
ncbi:MAG: hypothetical protein IKK27_10780 [Alistipes sp.]|nr:hypothetical protein [Alistipes sp.]